MPIISALRDYFCTCPLMDGSRINVDYLPEKGMECPIDSTPVTEIIKRYADGSTVRLFLFGVRGGAEYGADTLQNIANSGFFEALSAWLCAQTDAEIFPILESDKEPQKIEAQSTGYLFTTSAHSGKYQIQCRLVYLQKRS